MTPSEYITAQLQAWGLPHRLLGTLTDITPPAALAAIKPALLEARRTLQPTPLGIIHPADPDAPMALLLRALLQAIVDAHPKVTEAPLNPRLMWVSWPVEAADTRRCRRGDEALAERLRWLHAVPVLVLSGIGEETRRDDAAEEELQSLLEDRAHHNRPTLWTSRASLRHISERYPRARFNPAQIVEIA